MYLEVSIYVKLLLYVGNDIAFLNVEMGWGQISAMCLSVLVGFTWHSNTVIFTYLIDLRSRLQGKLFVIE